MDPRRRASLQTVVQASTLGGLSEGLARRAIENWTAIGAWQQNPQEVEVAAWAALADVGQVLA
eukprot:4740155-Lingulodinium_polyedra.AAC.1